MNSYLKVALLFLPFLCACRSEKSGKELYTGFPESIELQATTIELDTAVFRFPFRIRVHGNYAVIMDLHNDDCYYHLLSYPDMRYLAGFGKKGDSPEESLSGDDVRWVGDTIWTLDANKKELVAYLPGDTLQAIERVEVSETVRPLNFVFTDPSTLVIPDYTGEKRFYWMNRRGQVIQKTNTIPTEDEKSLAQCAPALSQAWRGFLDYNPQNGVLVSATQLGEVIEIYNIKNRTTHILQGPNGEPQFKTSGSYAIPTGIMGFSDIQVGKDFIYAVFHGRTFKEIIRLAQSGKDGVDGGKYIYVFSLTGKPVCKYVLDRYINGLYVDESRNLIIATDVNNDQPIVTYPLLRLEVPFCRTNT